MSWLYGLAGNVAAGMFRRAAREVAAHQRLAGRTLLDPDDYARVEERIDAARVLRRVYHAMQQLDEADRRLLELVAVDGLTTGQAADALRISAVAARVRLVRARRRLRSVLSVDRPHPAIPYLVKEESA